MNGYAALSFEKRGKTAYGTLIFSALLCKKRPQQFEPQMIGYIFYTVILRNKIRYINCQHTAAAQSKIGVYENN